MKKTYTKPTAKAVEIKSKVNILTGSDTSVKQMFYGGYNTGVDDPKAAEIKSENFWDDEWGWE